MISRDFHLFQLILIDFDCYFGRGVKKYQGIQREHEESLGILRDFKEFEEK